jgi:hypothetical protein
LIMRVPVIAGRDMLGKRTPRINVTRLGSLANLQDV